jgi:hypothetical protein
MVAAMIESDPGVASERTSHNAHNYFEDRAFFKKFGIHHREAGLKPTSKPAPHRRGFAAA